MTAPRRPRAREVGKLAIIALVFTAAPTAGDIGSCGQELADLDPAKFFAAKKKIDCERCTACDTGTFACGRACDESLPPEQIAFFEGCYPLVHDGEVCLNALDAASCDDYAGYLSDTAQTAPTECNFCPLETP